MTVNSGEGLVSGPGGDPMVRLQKVLAAAGVGSRRVCEQLIAEGRIAVDGQVVTEQGRRVNPATALVTVDGEAVVVAPGRVYLALHKPAGVLSAMSDSRGRPTVADLIGPRPERLFHIGRLDVDTEGLLLLTNDGALAHRIAHPSFGVSKTYLADVPGPVAKDLGRRLRAGVELEDGQVRVDRFRVIDGHGARALVELVLHEGRKHVVRRLLDAVGHPVRRLVRTRVGEVSLGDLKPGRSRALTRAEVASLYRATEAGSAGTGRSVDNPAERGGRVGARLR